MKNFISENFIIEGTVLKKYEGSAEVVVIPEGITEIDDLAFSDHKNLKEVTISKSVEKIGNSVFFFCDNLENIIIPESVKEIGNAIFWNFDLYNIVSQNINYSGTMEQWNNITKSSCWNIRSNSKTVTCSDGDIDIRYKYC